MRYECRIEDELERWGWQEHDGSRYGVQVIEDPKLNLKLTIKMVKSAESAGWNVRIFADPLAKELSMSVALVVYAVYDSEPGRFVGELDGDRVLFCEVFIK